jgi:hypothetical protein
VRRPTRPTRPTCPTRPTRLAAPPVLRKDGVLLKVMAALPRDGAALPKVMAALPRDGAALPRVMAALKDGALLQDTGMRSRHPDSLA